MNRAGKLKNLKSNFCYCLAVQRLSGDIKEGKSVVECLGKEPSLVLSASVIRRKTAASRSFQNKTQCAAPEMETLDLLDEQQKEPRGQFSRTLE